MKFRNTVIAWLHKGTAIACSDFKEPYVNNDPNGRPIARLFITLLMLAIIATGVIILYNSKASTKTERLFDKEYRDKMGTKEDDIQKNQNLNNLVCSCQKTALNWTKFTNFYIMMNKTNSLVLKPMTNDTVYELCESMKWNKLEPCKTLLNYCCGLESFTVLDTALLLSPVVFSNLFGRDLQSICTNQERYYYLLLQIIKDGNKGKPLLEILTRSLFAMAEAYARQPNNASDEYYWNAPSEIYAGFDTMLTNMSISFKMEVNWTNYMNICNPVYCDEVRAVSKLSRMLQSLAEVGGFFTVMLVLVRALVWPLLLRFCAWEREDPPKSTYSLSLS